MKPLVFIDGDQGTTGLGIAARLQRRSDLTLLSLSPEHRKHPDRRAEALDRCDVAILCLPDGPAREAVAMVTNPSVRIIDASSAHRIDPLWTYGLPEMTPQQEERIRSARRVSNPGCYPTGAIALLRPLVGAGLLPADYPVSIHAVSGYSGKGRAGIEEYENTDADAAAPLQVYGLDLEHKHVPEIQEHAGLAERPVFVPAYGAFRQGIVLTVPLQLRLMPEGASGRRLHECLQAHFQGAQHVKVLSPFDVGALPHLSPQALNGTDDLCLALFCNDRRGQVLLAAVFDNLGKGASGAAVQNLDLLLQAA